MSRCIGTFVLFALFVTPVAISQHAYLEPLKPIGVGWNTDKWAWMSFVAFSADGKRVASDGATNPQDVSMNLSFWTFPEGQLVRNVPVSPTALSPDWKYYATSHAIGEVQTGKPLLSLPGDAFTVFAFSPASHYVAESISHQGAGLGRIRVLELPNMRKVSEFSRHPAQSLAISPDETTLASGHWNAVVLWNMLTGRPIGELRGFGRYVVGLSFSRNGAYLAAGTDTGEVQIWDVRRRNLIITAKLGGQDVSNPAFSPDDSMVAVGVYGTGTVWLLDTHTGQQLDHRKVSDLGCGSVAFSPDGQFLITSSTGGIVTWPYDRGGTIRVFRVVRPHKSSLHE